MAENIILSEQGITLSSDFIAETMEDSIRDVITDTIDNVTDYDSFWDSVDEVMNEYCRSEKFKDLVRKAIASAEIDSEVHEQLQVIVENALEEKAEKILYNS